MAISHHIDEAFNIVYSFGMGIITANDLLTDQKQLKNDSKFNPNFNHLFDFTYVKKVNISTDDFRQFAPIQIFRKTSRCAVLVQHDALYGLARMYEVYGDRSTESFRIFKSMKSACEWLYLELHTAYKFQQNMINELTDNRK